MFQDEASWVFQFADVFNATTFLGFLKHCVRHFASRKIFMIIDNAPFHRLDDEGQQWLAANRHTIELSRLPPYSPEFNPTEGVWKTTRKMTTHNRFYATTTDRDTALRGTFRHFQRQPTLIAAQVRRFQ